ncbi:hypothetical protein [Sphingobacterium sp. LRF_L2]|uniref:hypothetical protein n=1 Tax=Sphingobacterium sp. LRF_L2 TaxID=3369421 RepID=UPI003F5DF25A
MKNKNEMCQKTIVANGIIIPASVTAEIVGCSVSAVKKVRNGFMGKTGRGKVCQAIVLADALLRQSITISVNHVDNVINGK